MPVGVMRVVQPCLRFFGPGWGDADGEGKNSTVPEVGMDRRPGRAGDAVADGAE